LEDGLLHCVNVYSGALTTVSDVAMITHASSRIPNDELLDPLLSIGLNPIAIGDCRAPRSLLATTREAYQIANSL
jgi:dimethylglycine catabolism A